MRGQTENGGVVMRNRPCRNCQEGKPNTNPFQELHIHPRIPVTLVAMIVAASVTKCPYPSPSCQTRLTIVNLVWQEKRCREKSSSHNTFLAHRCWPIWAGFNIPCGSSRPDRSEQVRPVSRFHTCQCVKKTLRLYANKPIYFTHCHV